MRPSATPRDMLRIAARASSAWIRITARCGGLPPRGDDLARARAEFERFLLGGAKAQDLEARGFQPAPRFLEAWTRKLAAALAAQGTRVVELGAGAPGDLGQHEPAAGFQHAADFAVEGVLVGDVHRHVHREGAVEARLGERHRERVAVLEAQRVAEAEPAGQVARDVAELGGEVDAGDAAAEAAVHVARRAADAAADVEQVVAGLDLERVGDLLGRLEAAGVELVVGRERLEARALRVGAVLGQRRLEPLEQAAAAVVAGDLALYAHRARY